jgi:TonB-linked SusC/RagA family outer membrane protein
MKRVNMEHNFKKSVLGQFLLLNLNRGVALPTHVSKQSYPINTISCFTPVQPAFYTVLCMKVVIEQAFIRKYWLLILITSLYSSTAFCQQKANSKEAQMPVQPVLPLKIENKSLVEALEVVARTFQVNIATGSSDLPTKFISIKTSGITLQEALRQVLEHTSFEAFYLSNGTIVIREKTSQQSVPAIQVTGQVTDIKTGEVIPGVSIVIKGTTTGTSTDAQGMYSLLVAEPNALVTVSSVGYQTAEINLTNQTRLDVQLTADIQALNEVVITALGLEREKKMLGYTAQTLENEKISVGRDANMLNQLAGKVAGLTVLNSPTGIGGSVRVIIRGERSLNLNKNQPLFVVDGVPVTNETVGSSGRNNQEVDYGNGVGMLNPDDIESMTILKGANATALYGSRGQNGVILIKTKSGRGTKGMGITIRSTVTFENPLRLPEYQNVYGQGINGSFEYRPEVGSFSWGPKMEGLPIKQFDSPTTNGFRGGDVGNLNTQIGAVDLPAQLNARGDILPTPFVPNADMLKNFFQTGVTNSQHVAINGGNEKGDIRIAYTYLDQKGYIPNTDLRRHTVALTSGYAVTPKLQVRLSSNYTKTLSDNRPNVTYGNENLMFFFNWVGRSVNVSSLRQYWQANRIGLNQFNSNYGAHDNPYFNLYENTNGQEVDRLFGNVSTSYQFNDWLTLLLRAGTDYSHEFRARRRAYSSQRFPLGSYREEQIFLQETNIDFLLSFRKKIGQLSVQVSTGGNQMQRKFSLSDISAPQLVIPGLYTLTNSKLPLEQGTFRSEKRIHSVYASSQIGYKEYVFLELTGRNDWSSTLPSSSRSYLYPSASLSFILSDIFRVAKGPLSFAKIRSGIAQVGNDTDPYQLESTFLMQQPVQGTPTYAGATFIPNPNLKPEKSISLETGAEVRFFNNRVGLDLSLYHTRSKNQILNAMVSTTSGYRSRVINAGCIMNQGIEAILNLTPVQLSNSFTWTIDVNFSRNRSKVLELYTNPISGQGIESHVVTARYINVEAQVGGRMGDMYGVGFQRVSTDPASPYFDPTGQYVGQIVYNKQGAPLATTTSVKLGNYNPDWTGGMYHTFSFKGWQAGILFDIRQGGHLYSHTQTVGREAGSLIETLEGRSNGYDLSVSGNGVVGTGVVAIRNAEGNITGFTPNTVKLSAQEWHTAITSNRRIREGMVYDASFVKVREVKVGYTLSGSRFDPAPFREISISIVGRNLFLWAQVPHIDPETASTAGGSIIPGVDSLALPSTRSYGFSLSITI